MDIFAWCHAFAFSPAINDALALAQMPLHHQQSTTHCELIGKSTQNGESNRKKTFKRMYNEILQKAEFRARKFFAAVI
ncbi:CLUMA_CG013925, isoform A [Clunio marinus]|uniref:CLUMA_CG013925, isoform A n=1 Tax=Clunio marinus TaxID=568069 RepID=A0A1J1IQ86_9DIPT|nr:CLUMA_CG013925, isoform A [Clunio marinus]